MNEACDKFCKHNSYCNLSNEKTLLCKNSDEEVDAYFEDTTKKIFGYSTSQIAGMQGRPGTDLK